MNTEISLFLPKTMNLNDDHIKISRFPSKIRRSTPKMYRRVFVKRMLALGLLTQIPLARAFQTKNNKEKPYKIQPDLLNEKQFNVLKEVQQHLFPVDDNSPGADQINATDYLAWVLSDPRKDPTDIKYIIDGIGWVDETADEEYGKTFLDLNEAEMEKLIAFIANEGWGSSWLSIVLSYIFEALVADPLYGGNTDESGWKWLSHFPGYPRPKGDLLYGNILKTVNEQ